MKGSGDGWPADDAPDSRPALSLADEGAADAPPPVEGDRYALGPLVGAGGMGRVVLAYDRLLGREVALKEVPPDADPVLRARLAREASILARLDHPGVVPVHDTGRRPDGTVFFAMRVVRGRTLAQLFADPAPDRDRLLRAVLAAAETVGFAHALGVIHRDLKPANILVGEFGETQVVDWGLARVLDQPDDAPPDLEAPRADAALTRVGAVLGTPQYMAPEQAAGRPADARSDVWSLGAVLFELVAGRAPHAGGSADEVLDAARAGPPPAATGRPGVPLELGAIIDRALAVDPALRYADAKALADDLARHLDGRRVEAYRYSTLDLLRRVVRAWRAPLTVGAVALAALVAAGVLGWRATDAERVRAQSAEAAARAALDRADRDLARALVAEALDRAADEAAPEAAVLAAHALRLAESADARGVLMRFAGAPRPALIDERPLPGGCAAPLPAADGALTCPATLSRPLRHVGPGLRVWWDAGFLTVQRGEAAPWTRRACDPGGIDAVAIDEARARWAALCSQGELRVAGLAEDATPAVAPLALTADRQPAAAAAFTPDGGRLVVGTLTGHVVVLDGATGAILRRVAGDGRPARAVDVSADGRVAAVLGDRGGARLWDITTGAWLGRLPARWAGRVRFAADAPRDLWTVGPTLRRWRLPAAAPTRLDVAAGVTALALRGERLAVSRSGGLDLFDLPAGDARARLDWPGVVKGAVFLPDGDVVATSARDHRTRRFRGDLTEAPTMDRKIAKRIGLLMSPAGPRVLLATYEPGLRVLDPAGAPPAVIAPDAVFLDLAVTPDARHAAALREAPRAVCRVDAAPTVRLGPCAPAPDARAVALDPVTGTLLAAVVGAVDLYGPDGARRGRLEAAPDAELIELAVSPDGRFVAAGDRAGTLWVWRDGDPRPRARMQDHAERLAALTFAPDGDLLLTGGWDGAVRLRRLAPLHADRAALATQTEAAWRLTLDEVW